jgi:hypothetical protein
MRAWAAGLRASGARFALRSARPSRASSGHFKGDLGAAPRGPPRPPRLRLTCVYWVSHLHRHECRCDMDRSCVPASEDFDTGYRSYWTAR